MQSLLKGSRMPTAVMCSNDMTGIGVLHQLFEEGIDVPAAMSVIGFDDVHIAQFTLPPLTTIRMACEDIAHAAFQSLRSGIEKRSSGTPPRRVPTKLIVRQTTARPADSSKLPEGKRRSRSG